MANYTDVVPLACSVPEAIERVTAALADVGFGVLTSIDVQATFKAKLNVDRAPYTILGACHPTLAQRALEIDPAVGVFMPCSVVVRAAGDHAEVLIPSAVVQLQPIGKAAMHKLAEEVDVLMDKVSAALRTR